MNHCAKKCKAVPSPSRHFSTAFANHHSFQPLPLDSREFGRVAANPSFMRIRLNHLRWHWTYSVSTESYSWLIAYTSVTFRETMFLGRSLIEPGDMIMQLVGRAAPSD